MLHVCRSSVCYITTRSNKLVLQHFSSRSTMDRLIRRKPVGADMRTGAAKSEPSTEEVQEGRLLRSRSGRKFPEKTLTDALAQSAKLETRGLGKRPVALADMSNGAGVTLAREKSGKRPGARATQSQGLEERAALAHSDEPLLIGQQLHPPIRQSASCTKALFPVWTQENLLKASQHLCAADPCRFFALGLSFVPPAMSPVSLSCNMNLDLCMLFYISLPHSESE